MRLASAVSKKLDEGYIRGAVRLVSSSDKVAPFNEETLSKLREKHPPRPNDRKKVPTTDDVPPLQVDINEVRSAIKSFSAGSGPLGLRMER